VLLFAGLLPEARALQLVLLLRLVTIASDLAVFGLALWLRRAARDEAVGGVEYRRGSRAAASNELGPGGG
jgi:hypothetical protein